ncbi:myosin regulatory light chain 12 [Nematocida displodere]|uniref:Myosin regulatory light chain 12 n=1 Tax=Nematocida displodere TaxID=1805483 RepID=A0A177EIS7_9MICR|nr:myosin regulatory light chain 12 [Nematocida displodere]
MNRKKRTARQSSNVFTAFTHPQILELREVFSLLDGTADGKISKEDLETFLESIGSPHTEEEIEGMMHDLGGSTFCFTTFLTALCEKLSNIDSENVLARALGIFDPGLRGSISVSELKEALTTSGDRLTPGEWAVLEKQLSPADGHVQAKDLAREIRHCGLAPSE